MGYWCNEYLYEKEIVGILLQLESPPVLFILSPRIFWPLVHFFEEKAKALEI